MGEKIPPDWSPSETSGKTIDAADKGVTKQITDSVIINAIADDIYIRIGASAEVSSRVGGQKLFDFLDLEQKTELSTRYQLPVSSYWVIDDKPGPRGPYEIGQKIGLSWVKILYERKDTNDRGSIPFRKVWEAFNEIKSR